MTEQVAGGLEMNEDIFLLFSRMPGALPLYQAAEALLVELYPAVSRKVGRTQVSFSARYGFAFLWPPKGRIGGVSDSSLGLSFGLGHEVRDSRILRAVEPYPGRWTHHMILQGPQDLDEQLRDWLGQALAFGLNRGRT